MYQLISCASQFFKTASWCSSAPQPTPPKKKTYSRILRLQNLCWDSHRVTDFAKKTSCTFAPGVLQVKGNLRSQVAKGLIVQEADPEPSKWSTQQLQLSWTSPYRTEPFQKERELNVFQTTMLVWAVGREGSGITYHIYIYKIAYAYYAIFFCSCWPQPHGPLSNFRAVPLCWQVTALRQ